MCVISAEIAPKTAEEAGLCAEAHHHGRAQIICYCHPQRATYRGSRSGIEGEQSRREFTSARATARTKTATVQVGRISATLSVSSCRCLQCLLRPTSSPAPPHLQKISSRHVCRLAAKLPSNLIYECDALRIIAVVNVSMPPMKISAEVLCSGIALSKRNQDPKKTAVPARRGTAKKDGPRAALILIILSCVPSQLAALVPASRTSPASRGDARARSSTDTIPTTEPSRL